MRHCARAELAASLWQTEEVALPWGWDGGWLDVPVIICEYFETSKSKDIYKFRSDHQQMSKYQLHTLVT